MISHFYVNIGVPRSNTVILTEIPTWTMDPRARRYRQASSAKIKSIGLFWHRRWSNPSSQFPRTVMTLLSFLNQQWFTGQLRPGDCIDGASEGQKNRPWVCECVFPAKLSQHITAITGIGLFLSLYLSYTYTHRYYRHSPSISPVLDTHAHAQTVCRVLVS